MRDWTAVRDELPRIPETIVIAGPCASGKTTVARALAASFREQGRKVEIVSRADTFDMERTRSRVGNEGVVIFDCQPPVQIESHLLVRYITCGAIL